MIHHYAWRTRLACGLLLPWRTRLACGSVFHSHVGRVRHEASRVRYVLLLAALALSAGCRQEMAAQPAYRPLAASKFFADGQSARPIVAGTVARGETRLDVPFYTGLREGPVRELPGSSEPQGGEVGLTVARTDLQEKPYIDYLPIPVDSKTLEHGQTRFMVYCAVCHGADGTGNGPVVERGFTPPPTYHSDRLRRAPLGYFFDVISRGYGSMPNYSKQIPARDRWTIAAYLRALQLSRHARLEDLPEAERRTVLSQLEGEGEQRRSTGTK